MKKLGLLSLLLLTACANNPQAGSAIGGAVGGAAGATVGYDVGGRSGSIIGGALGAAAGAILGGDASRRNQPTAPIERAREPEYRDGGDGEHRDQRRRHDHEAD